MQKIVILIALFFYLGQTFAQKDVYFRDDFKDNTFKWNYDTNRELTIYIEDSCLIISNISSIHKPVRYVRNLFLCNDSDFVIETKFRFFDVQDESLAALIWHSKDNANGFYFEIKNTGNVHIWGNKMNKNADFLPPTQFPSFSGTDWLTLKIKKTGQTQDFYVNNILVFTSPYRGLLGSELGFAIGKYTNILVDYIQVEHAPIKETNPKIAEKLSDDDLYWIIKEEKYKEQITILGKIYDMNTGGIIRNADVSIFDTLDNQLNNLKSDTEGNFLIQTKFTERINLKVRQDGYLMNAKEFNFSVNDESFERRYDFQLQRIEVGKVFALKNVLFEQGNSELLPESYVELNKLVDMMKDNPKLEIELGGHTDNSGTVEKNLRLSEDRVEAVKSYLVEKGIHASRVVGKGYGGDFPIASNNSDLTRRLNRRVEFKITKM